MFKRNNEKTEPQWKAKYFSSLEELEAKEKQWNLLDEAMRKSVSRMSVLINGVDRQLDKDLDYLRLSIRKGADGKKIRAILENVFTSLEKVESERGQRKRVSAAQAYELLLDRLEFPKAAARRVKALKKSIGRLGEDDSPTEVIREFEELIHTSLSLMKESAKDNAGASAVSETPAARLNEPVQRADVGGSPDRADIKSAVAATTISAPDTHNAGQSGQKVLTELMKQLSLPQAMTHDLASMQQRLQSTFVDAELSRLAVQLAGIINNALSSTQVEELLQADGGLTINEVLLQLLDKIELPAEASEDILQIQQRLESEVSTEEWPEVLEQISRLIRAMREKANEEKKDLESFLAQLTEQLQTLDNFISGVELEHQESIQEGKALSDRMRDHIRHIGQSVDDAAELEQLKNAVRERLQTISQHMTAFREYEEGRDERAQQKINELTERIRIMEQDSEQLRDKVRQERESALVDPLTGVRNRLAYDERVEQEYARWKRYQTSLSLIVIDIDFFKKINDSFGHIAGDKVLHTVAQNLQKNIRETDFLARYGGEEFVILMPDTAADEGLAVADKVREVVEHCGFHYRGEAVRVTISCGVAEFSQGDSPARVFEKADHAMYRAKSEGRNRCFRA